MEEMIKEMISYYKIKIADVKQKRKYFGRQQHTKGLVDYKAISKSDLETISIYEDFIADLGRLYAKSAILESTRTTTG